MLAVRVEGGLKEEISTFSGQLATASKETISGNRSQKPSERPLGDVRSQSALTRPEKTLT